MIRYSYRRRPGGRRYAASDRAAARAADAAGLAATLTPAAVAAMSDPAGIEVLFEASFEVESNRLNRPVTATFHEVRSGTDTQINPDTYHVRDSAALGSGGGAMAGMRPEYVVDGKRNPSRPFAIADAYRADDSTCFDNYTTPYESTAVSFSRQYGGGRAIAYNGNARDVVAAGARGEWLIGTDATPYVMTRSGDYTDAGRIAYDDAFTGMLDKRTAWVATNGTSGLVATGRTAIFPRSTTTTRYLIPASGSRTFTLAAQVAADTSTTFTPQLRVTLSTGETVDLSGTPTVVAPPAAKMFRPVSSVFTVTGTPGATITSIQPRIGVGTGTNGTDPTRIEVGTVAAYAGDQLRGDPYAIDAAVPLSPVYVLLDMSAGNAWNVNRIDVAGDSLASRITSATADIQTTPGGAFTSTGKVAAGSNGITIELDNPTAVYGVKVWVEESTAGENGFTYLTEIDSAYVRDVTDDVVSADLEWSREVDPGTADSPVGNYESSTLTLTLDDTSGEWDPTSNVSLDLGHRIEAAIGVRYTNLLENPRGDSDTSGWNDFTNQSPVFERVAFDPESGAPAGTGFRESLASVTTYGWFGPQSDPWDVTPGQVWRIGAWVKLDGPPGSLVELRGYVATTTSFSAAAVNPGTGWQYRTLDVTIPAGSSTAWINVWGKTMATAGPVTLEFTNVSASLVENGSVVTWEELVPAGVFYSLPYDTDSQSTTVSITANDRLSTYSSSEVTDTVQTNRRLRSIVTDLAVKYLDMSPDQVVVDSSIADTTFPYLFPTGDVGTYLADLAKSVMGTIHVDAYERLVLTPYGATVDDSTGVEIRADNALISHKRPPGYDVTTSRVHVAAAPLTLGPDSELWSLSEPVTIQPGGADVPVVAFYSDSPALNQYLTGYDYDTGIELYDVHHYAGFSTWSFHRNDSTAPAGQPVTQRGLKINGTPLVEGTLDVVKEHAPSLNRYGPRTLDVDARLAQTQAQVDAAATILLDAFRSLDDNGNRRIPDVSIDALGLFHLEAGDRVTLKDPAKGLGADYTLLGRRLAYSDGGLLISDTRLRESTTVVFTVADQDLADDTNVVIAY